MQDLTQSQSLTDPFIHLRVHTTYSLSEGASYPKDLLGLAKNLNMPALAISDRNSMHGVFDFSMKAKDYKVQPIIGIQLSVSLGSKPGSLTGNIILFACTEQAFHNINALHLRASRSEFASEGLPIECLRGYTKDVICLTGGGEDGLLPLSMNKSSQLGISCLRTLLEIFGSGLYVEICRNAPPSVESEIVEKGLIDLAEGQAGEVVCLDGIRRDKIPLVATIDTWHATPEGRDAWLMLRAISSGGRVKMLNDGTLDSKAPQCHLRSQEEAKKIFEDLPEAVNNTWSIARRCAFMVMKHKPTLPAFPVPEGQSEEEFLRVMSLEGLRKRLTEIELPEEEHPKYLKRLDYELGIINRMGFPGYFLIVADFIQWARRQDIPVGPGRGSGAGSIVAWALTITDINPMEFGLLFERFLNPDRVSMPDFDIDFCKDRREEVRSYIATRYGEDHVGMITAFGKIKGRTALQDAQRVLYHETYGQAAYGFMTAIKDVLPQHADPNKKTESMPILEAYNTNDAFRAKVNEEPIGPILCRMAGKIEGLIRDRSSHAAGAVIGNTKITDITPVIYDPKAGQNGFLVCDFDMKGVESVGLVKFDLLGLVTLSIIHKALLFIKQMHGTSINPSLIPRDDKGVFEMLSEGHATAVFQFEGGGMRDALMKVKPERLEDLIAIVALYRPGPMAYISNYVARKEGEPYETPGGDRCKPILDETYGIMVYQEQVMGVAQEVAGYSLGSADLLRRAMGKKIAEEMKKQEHTFIYGDPESNPPIPGAIARGMTEKDAIKLFNDIKPFADYGFNKSHAAAYAWVGYITAWLKFHYPAEFLAAQISYYDKPEKRSLVKEELDRLGIRMLPPDINFSCTDFRPERDEKSKGGIGVRFGLSAVKGVTDEDGAFEAERTKNGKFKDLSDFMTRVGKITTSDQRSALVACGAFDSLWPVRSQAEEILNWIAGDKGKKKKEELSSDDIFSATGVNAGIVIPEKFKEIAEWGNRADREYSAVGFYFGRHPLDRYLKRMIKGGVRRRRSIVDWLKANNKERINSRRLAVMVEDVKRLRSRKNTEYILLIASEKNDSYTASFFPSNYNQNGGWSLDHIFKVLQGAKISRIPVIMEASISWDGTRSSQFINAVWTANEFLEGVHGDLTVDIKSTEIPPDAALMMSGGDDAHILKKVVEKTVKRVEALFLPKTHEKGSAVRIRIDGDSSELIELPGRYLMSNPLEGALMSMPGVIGIHDSLDE